MYSLLLFFFFPDLQGFACMMCTFPEMCILPSWVCSTQGVVGKDLTTVSPGGRVWFVELADFRGVNTQTIADFRLPIGSLSAELGRNMCNWLCKPVWAASAHPWLHLSAWIAALRGSLLWLQPAGHTHDTLHFCHCPFVHWHTFPFLHLFLPQTHLHGDRDHRFSSVFGVQHSAWHTVVTWSVFMEWVRVAFLCQNKCFVLFFLLQPDYIVYCS